MTDNDWLAERFEEQRPHLRAVAYRMLGSLGEAEDAVQEAWLKASRAGPDGVRSLGGWLTTVVARVCLDALRSRRARREELVGEPAAEPAGAPRGTAADPAAEAELADSVGLALLVVLDLLGPAERLAFVLHDLFAMPFEEIAPVVGRSPAATRQLASRARRRVRGGDRVRRADTAEQRAVVAAFLAAARGGDLSALVEVLDPDVVLRVGATAAEPAHEVRGATAVAGRALLFARSAPAARLILVNGAVGFVVAPLGRLQRVLAFTITDGRISGIDVTSDPRAARELDLALPDMA